jgi:hypothetical protein
LTTCIAGLLRACREWPRRRAAEQRDELAPPQLIALHSVPSRQGQALQDIELADVSQEVVGLVVQKLRSVHRSKEASGLHVYWTAHWSHRIIDTTVETFIRRWRCHVSGNDFTSFW